MRRFGKYVFLRKNNNCSLFVQFLSVYNQQYDYLLHLNIQADYFLLHILLFLIAGESVPALRANLDFYRYLNCWTVQKFIFKEKLLRSSASFLCTLAGSVLLGIDIKCIKFKVSLEYGMVEPYGFVPKCHTWVFHFCMKIWLDIMGQLIWFRLLSDLLSLMSRTKYHHQPSYFLNHLFA